MHWEARYGKEENIKKFIRHEAVEFIPDCKGFRPIDYAGKFYQVKAMKVLIETSKNKIMSPENDKNNHALGLKMKFEKKKFSDKFNPFEFEELIHSPVYQTSLLYWACYLPEKEICISEIKEILENLEAYPEGPVKI